MSAAPKERDPDRWCFATSPTGRKCLGRIGHPEDHAAYSKAPEPFEVWPLVDDSDGPTDSELAPELPGAPS